MKVVQLLFIFYLFFNSFVSFCQIEVILPVELSNKIDLNKVVITDTSEIIYDDYIDFTCGLRLDGIINCKIIKYEKGSHEETFSYFLFNDSVFVDIRDFLVLNEICKPEINSFLFDNDSIFRYINSIDKTIKRLKKNEFGWDYFDKMLGERLGCSFFLTIYDPFEDGIKQALKPNSGFINIQELNLFLKETKLRIGISFSSYQIAINKTRNISEWCYQSREVLIDLINSRLIKSAIISPVNYFFECDLD